MKVLRVRPCFVLDYELALATGEPGDVYIFDDASAEAHPHLIPSAPDVVHTVFPRRGNMRGRPCHRAFWELYLRLLDAHGCTHVFEVPPDVIVTQPALFERQTAALVGVARRDEEHTWNQWGCGQMVSREGLRVALDRLDGDRDLETVNHNDVTFQDVALSWLLRDRSISLPWWRACFVLRGDVPGAQHAFVNFDNFDSSNRSANERRPIATAAAIEFRKTLVRGDRV